MAERAIKIKVGLVCHHFLPRWPADDPHGRFAAHDEGETQPKMPQFCAFSAGNLISTSPVPMETSKISLALDSVA